MGPLGLQLSGSLLHILDEAFFLVGSVDFGLLIILLFEDLLVGVGMSPASGEVSEEVYALDLTELLEVLHNVFFR